jgi:hypothetical protein
VQQQQMLRHNGRQWFKIYRSDRSSSESTNDLLQRDHKLHVTTNRPMRGLAAQQLALALLAVNSNMTRIIKFENALREQQLREAAGRAPVRRKQAYLIRSEVLREKQHPEAAHAEARDEPRCAFCCALTRIVISYAITFARGYGATCEWPLASAEEWQAVALESGCGELLQERRVLEVLGPGLRDELDVPVTELCELGERLREFVRVAEASSELASLAPHFSGERRGRNPCSRPMDVPAGRSRAFGDPGHQGGVASGTRKLGSTDGGRLGLKLEPFRARGLQRLRPPPEARSWRNDGAKPYDFRRRHC